MSGIGETIKEARLALGWSQEELAAKVRRITGSGFTRAALALIEAGSTKIPKPHNLQAACDAMGIDFRGALMGKLVWITQGSYAMESTVGMEAPAPINPHYSETRRSDTPAVIDSDLLHDVQTEVDAYIVKHNIALYPRQRTALIVATYLIVEPMKRVSDADVASALADIMALAKKQTHG